MSQRIIQGLKATPFYEIVRRFRTVYGVMDKRGRQMILVTQANNVLKVLVGTLGFASIAAFLVVLSRPEIIVGNRYLNMVYQALGFTNEAYFLVLLSGFLVLAAIAHQVFTVFSHILTVRLNEGMMRRCTVMLYRYYLAEGYESHIRRGVSNAIAKSLIETKIVVGKEVNKISSFLAAMVNIVFILGGLFIINASVLIILICCTVLAYTIFFALYKNRVRVAGGKIFQQRMKQVHLVREGTGATTEIRLMGKEREFTQQVHNSLVQMSQRKIQHALMTGIPQRTVWVASICVLYIIAVYILVSDGPKEAFITLAIFSVAIFRLLPSVQAVFGMLMSQVGDITQFEAVIEDLQSAKKYLADNDGQEDKKAFQLILVKDKIVFDNVSYTYPETDKPVIRNLSFSLPANKVIALFGRSGVGKTTVIRLLSGLLFPREGRVLVDGRSLQEDSAFTRNWQKSSSFVLQNPFFMNATLAMNIAFEAAEDKIDYERVREVAKLAQLEDFVASLPDGFDTDVEESAEILSGGQRQRLAIARALYRNSSVLVLDEATNALDLVVEKKIISSLMSIGGNKMVIIIAHRPDTMRFADIVLVMKEDGSIAQGGYDELLAQDPDFRALVGAVGRAAG